MNQEWILQTRETRRLFASSTWVPLRSSLKSVSWQSDVTVVGHVSEHFACGSVAFPAEHREEAERLSWSHIGIGHSVRPHAYEDGYYSPVDQYQFHDKEPLGVELVFEHDQPVVGGKQWILNPDLVIALRLIKDGNNWVRPEEDFTVVAREIIDKSGSHSHIEIKREFLLDYLAARGLSLRLSYYRQRVENVSSLAASEYSTLASQKDSRDGGRFELLIRELNDVYGGGWASIRMWRTDVDPEEDAPVMGPENNDNTAYENSEGHRGGFSGVRIEGEFWRDEWIDSQNKSIRVRGDEDQTRPSFIVETDGARLPSKDLDSDDIGRWLWFRSGVMNELLSRRGFSLEWYTRDTGAIVSTSGYRTHFGINASDFITVYAHDVAKLPTWEQHVWASHNVVPEGGGVAAELHMAQVKTSPAETKAFEELFFFTLRKLDNSFQRKFGAKLYSHDIDDQVAMQSISRFMSRDRASLLRLAKELIRAFSDRIDVRELRKLSTHAEKEKLGSIKLLQDLVAKKVGDDEARRMCAVLVGVYDMRVGDAHPTGSKITDAIKLAGVDESSSFMEQGKQIIYNFGIAIWDIGAALFIEEEQKLSPGEQPRR